jgi:ferrochelatase
MGKKGVLLMNVGTPDEPTIASVRTYLREFLLDPDVIDIPAPLRHLLVRGIILRVRPKKIAPLYQKIWMDGGSPLRVYSNKISSSLDEGLADIEFEVGMRYGNPSIHDGLERLRGKGVDELLLLPMFPHYAQATTESSLKHAHKQLRTMKWAPNLLEMHHFHWPIQSNLTSPQTRIFCSHITACPFLTSNGLTLRKSTARRLRIAVLFAAKPTSCATAITVWKRPLPSHKPLA